MNRDFAQIRQGIERYCHAVHTQEREDIMSVLANGIETVLISPAGYHVGNERIWQDFLVGGIRKAYEKIDLIADSIEYRQVSEDTIIALFRYHTECIRREDGSESGIAGLETQAWVRQGDGWKLAHVHYSVQK